MLSGTAPNLTYTPNANYSGADSFTFTVSDGLVTSPQATVSIAVVAGLRNGSFELGDFISAVPFPRYLLEDWTVTGDPVGFAQVLPSRPGYGRFPDQRFSDGGNIYGDTISQTFATIPGAIYRLEFDVGIIVGQDQAPRQQLLGVAIGGAAWCRMCLSQERRGLLSGLQGLLVHRRRSEEHADLYGQRRHARRGLGGRL